MPKPSAVEKKLLHNMGRAISEFDMIQRGDPILVCLSGGKDSFTMVHLLHKMHQRSPKKFTMLVFTLDQSQPGWDDSQMRQWLEERQIRYRILKRDTYSVVKEKIPEGKTYCSLCSRLRRGNIYRFAEENGFKKVALGHHRDDLIQSLLMSILYNGEIRTMPAKLLTDSKKQIVIRPLVYCQEKDIEQYAKEQNFPIIPCNLCGSQENLARKKVKRLIDGLAQDNPKVPSNMLNALANLSPSTLLDARYFDFKNLEQQLEILDSIDMESELNATFEQV